jgi:hypothetical protein
MKPILIFVAFALALLVSCSNGDNEIQFHLAGTDLGVLTLNNAFLYLHPTIQHVQTVEELKVYGNNAVTVRLNLKKNEDVKDLIEFYGYLNFISRGGDTLPRVKIQFFRNDYTAAYYTFTSQVAENGVFTKGKPILLVSDPELAASVYSDFYIVLSSNDWESWTIYIPFGQFN